MYLISFLMHKMICASSTSQEASPVTNSNNLNAEEHSRKVGIGKQVFNRLKN